MQELYETYEMVAAWNRRVASTRSLMPAPAGWKGSQIASPMSGLPVKVSIEQLRVEPAGKPFEEYLHRCLGLLEWERGEQAPIAEEEEITLDDATRAHAERTKKKQMAALQFAEDPYELLGLGHLRWRATDDDIRKAYRKQCLLHHPDKKMGSAEADADEDVDEMFKALTRANDTLSNEEKRRAFDSQEPFDDSIPSESIKLENDQQFFDVFAPVFDRNAKWSKIKPIPELGDNDTPHEKVMEFYDFWLSFKSWRTFSGSEEYNPEEAESREEKRWMERQNKKEKERQKKEELSRMNSLIENAFKRDPRIKRHNQMVKDEKKKKKQERFNAIRKAKEEQERKETEERERIEREAKAKAEEETKKKQQLANALRSARARLRKLCSTTTNIFSVATSDVDLLCSSLPVEKLQALCNTIQNNPSTAQQAFDAEVKEIKGAKQEVEEKEKAKKEEGAKVKTTPWEEDELGLLAQGIARFPGGTPNRWRLIADMVNQRSSNMSKGRSIKEVIAKITEIREAQDLHDKNAVGMKVDGDFERFRSKLVQSNKVNKNGPIGGVTLRSQLWDLPGSGPRQPTPQPTPQPKPQPKPQPQAAQTQAKPAPSAAAPAPAEKKAEEDWSQDQQSALEAALKTYPASLGVERWEKIAAAVPGKTKKDCVERYKILVARIKSKAAGAK